MKKTFSTSLALILVTVLAFVCISKPLQARADSASMDYLETDMSTSEVKALFSGSAAFIPAAVMIIGFIVMCYCVLRNVEVPLDFADQTSFTDKLTQLGQYAIDNAGDSIKDFLYSVYTYCNDNGITSIWGLSKFIGLQAGKFFGAITSWIGGSLINNPTDIGKGLIDSFSTNPFVSFNQYSYVDSFKSVFNQYSGFNYSNTAGIFYYAYYCFINGFQNLTSADAFVITPFGIGIYQLSNGSLVKSSANFILYQFTYKGYNSVYNVAPNLSSYSAASYFNVVSSFDFNTISSGRAYGIDQDRFLQYLLMLNHSVYTAEALLNTIPAGSFNPYLQQDILNPAVDNVYVPTDVWWLDIAATWESINANQAKLLDQTAKIAAFVGSIPLTLTAADAYAPTINDAGNYVFPDMTDIWKYPQYFFDTLKGWGSFVGNCLRSVTVGEGGLSWIFYGGFVLLVCGGIIGKILMG